jgi:hypothetical protein
LSINDVIIYGENNLENATLKPVKAVKEQIVSLVTGKISPKMGNGDIFRLTREIEIEAENHGLDIENTSDIYNWLIELRDQIKKYTQSKKEVTPNDSNSTDSDIKKS